MLNVKQIRERLKDRRVNFVAKTIGVDPKTVANVRDGKNCTAATLEKLSKYFEERENRG